MTHLDGPLVSVVTPVYNGEKYLDECIRSVRNQTYQNWEYVILNNCSTDRSLEIASSYASQDKRIRVVNTDKLLPLISNHNYALRQISQNSKYCKMLHADDALFSNCLELMVSAAEKNPTAGIVGAYSLWGRKVVSDGLSHTTTFLSGKELCRLTFLGQLYCFWSPSSLLITSDLIRRRDSFYNEKHLHADDEACYEALKETDFAFVHQVLTFIRTHDESATSSMTAAYNKTILSNFDLFLRFGPFFLSQAEFQEQLSIKLRRYYHFLAGSLFSMREKEFWRYHRETRMKIGMPFSWARLARAILSEFIERPVGSVRAFLNALRSC